MTQSTVFYLKVIPDFDRQKKPKFNYVEIHIDVTVISQMFRLIVSFRWRPLLDDNFVRDISQWIQEPSAASLNPDENYPPHFILIGNLKCQHQFLQ